MTHFRSSKRLPGPGSGLGPGRVLITVTALVAALGLGVVAPAEAVSESAGRTPGPTVSRPWRAERREAPAARSSP